MPKLPKPKKPNYLPDKPKRKPSSDYKFYNSQRWRAYSRRYRTVCEVCTAEGQMKDITPSAKGNRGVVDHIVPIQQGGSKWDEHNHMGMCGHHHSVKRGLETHDYCVETTQGTGGLIPMDRSEIIDKLTGATDAVEEWIPSNHPKNH